MCFKIIPTYGNCGHNGIDNPALIMWEMQYCSKKLKGECPNLRTKSEDHPDSECWECVGLETQDYYKHCYESTICEHEYDHMFTDLVRYRWEDDIVLVTPEYELCPPCKAAGYGNRPVSEIPKTKSIMPQEFENLTRRSLVPSEGGASIIPGSDTFASTASLRPGASRVPSNTYNPSVGRAPPGSTRVPSSSRVPSSIRRPTEAPAYNTNAPTRQPGTHYPPSGYPVSSHVPSNMPPSTSTQIYSPTSKAPTSCPEASTKPLTAAELLARGPPKNVAASAFYDNPDGADARARLSGGSIMPAQSTRSGSKIPSSRPSNRNSAHSSLESSTHAPPADAPSLDLDALMGNMTIAPSSRPSSSRAPGSASKAPTTSLGPPSSRPSSSQHPSSGTSVAPKTTDSRTAAGNSVYPNGRAPASQVPSSSRTPGTSTVPSPTCVPGSTQLLSSPRASASGNGTALPGYKSMASPKSAFPSQPPPKFETTNPPAPRAKADERVRGMSAVPEGDEDLYRA